MVKEMFSRVFKLNETGNQETVQQEDQAQSTTTIVVHTQGIGSTGTQSYHGYPSEEYLSNLRGKDRADIFDRMRRSDPQIRMALKAVMDPIKSATWEIEPADQTADAIADAELMKHIFFEDMDKPFEEFLSEALSFIVFGHSVFEVTHKVVLNHPTFGSYNGIKALAFRSQKTIYQWNLNPETDQLASITQIVNGDLSRYVDIPAEFLIVFTLDKEGSNYEGVSAIRSCYGNWLRKDLYLKLNAIGIEKFAVPTPIVTVPAGKAQGESFDAMMTALEAYTSHEKNYLTKPAGWDIELKSNAYDPEKVEVSIDNEDKRMVKSFMANFLELGMNGFGSQSLSFDLSDFFLNSLDHIAKLISGTINRDLIPALVKMNRGPRAKYPRLKHAGLSDRAAKELADVLKALRDGDYISPDDPLEAHLRKRLGLPEMSLVGRREKQKQALFSEKMSLSERIAARRRS